MENKIVESFDRTKIALNHFKKDGRDAVLIICHGFAMSKDSKPFLNLSNDLFQLYDIIAMDQRGHGNSEGVFSFSSKEHEDIKVVVEYAKQNYTCIYLMGFSLGAASCIIEVAINKNVHGLITVSAPISFEKIENRFLYKDALIPSIQKFGGHTLKMRLGNMFAKKEKPIDVIDSISPIPILLIQGENDPIIFKHHAQTLYEKAKDPKKLVIIEKGLHAEDLYINNPKEFVSLCNSWLREFALIK